MRQQELTPKQIESLCSAIESSIPSQDDLEQVVYYCLEEDLSSMTGPGTYPKVIFDLVRWSNRQGDICKLIVNICYKNPGNLELRKFLSNHWLSFLDFSKSPLTDIQRINLVEYLGKIEDFQKVVVPACKKTLPGFSDHHDDLLTRLVDSQLSPILRWGLTLELFLEQYVGPQSNGCLPIINFVKNLSEFAANEKSSLQEWLSNLPPNLQPSSQKILLNETQDPLAPEQLRTLKAELLISVEYPEETAGLENNDFSVNGYLITRFGDRNQKSKIKNIPLIMDENKSSEEQDSDDISDLTNRSCTIQEIQNIKDKLPEWIKQIESLVQEQCLTVKADYGLKDEPTYDLTVEFWLPFEHLLAKVESWEVYKPAPRRNRRTAPLKTPLSKKHGVLVRSYDRFKDTDAVNVLRRSWEQLSSVPQDSASEPASTCCRVHLENWEQEHWDSIRKQLFTQSYWGVMLSCPLCSGEGLKKWEDLFEFMLERGIPIALWSRNAGLANLKTELDALWASGERSEILGKVREKRRQAYEADDLGHHLAIWCDEPQRFMELKNFLGTGRLRA